MSTLLIYAHLAVIFLVGVAFTYFDTKWARTIGALNGFFAMICAYGYAIYQLVQVWR